MCRRRHRCRHRCLIRPIPPPWLNRPTDPLHQQHQAPVRDIGSRCPRVNGSAVRLFAPTGEHRLQKPAWSTTAAGRSFASHRRPILIITRRSAMVMAAPGSAAGTDIGFEPRPALKRTDRARRIAPYIAGVGSRLRKNSVDQPFLEIGLGRSLPSRVARSSARSASFS